MPKLRSLNDWSKGEYDNRLVAPTGTFYASEDMNTQEPGILKVAPLTSADTNSGDIDNPIFAQVDRPGVGSDAIVGVGGVSTGSTGDIYFKVSSTWTKAYTGSSLFTGAIVHNKDLYMTNETQLVEIDNANVGSSIAGGDINVKGTLTNGGTDINPIIEAQGSLWIGDGNVLAQWDGTSFTATRIELPTDNIITGLTYYGGFLRIYTKFGSTERGFHSGNIFMYDLISDSYNEKIEIDYPIRCVANRGNFDMVIAGSIPKLIKTQGYQRAIIREIPGYGLSTPGERLPYSITEFGNYIAFTNASNRAGSRGGVWLYGSKGNNYTSQLVKMYTGSVNGPMYSILNKRGQLFTSWKNVTTYGVDEHRSLLDTSLATQGSMESNTLMDTSYLPKEVKRVYIGCSPLGGSDTIILQLQKEGTSYSTVMTLDGSTEAGIDFKEEFNAFDDINDFHKLEAKVIVQGDVEIYDIGIVRDYTKDL